MFPVMFLLTVLSYLVCLEVFVCNVDIVGRSLWRLWIDYLPLLSLVLDGSEAYEEPLWFCGCSLVLLVILWSDTQGMRILGFMGTLSCLWSHSSHTGALLNCCLSSLGSCSLPRLLELSIHSQNGED